VAGEDGRLCWGKAVSDGTEPDPHHVAFQPRGGAEHALDVPPLPLFERAGVLRAFLDAVDGNGVPTSPADDNAHTVAILEAAVTSRERGERTAVARW
ncbi:MAG: hypothetical protein WA971_08670, partial [Microbacterium sp.]